MNDERRKEGRVQAIIEVIWEGANTQYQARTSDLTTSGCFIDTIGQAAVGDIVTFKLLLPAKDSIEIQGEVLYSYPHSGFGVRFTNVSDTDQKKLEWLVKARALA